jgi:hypothetical protein
MTTITTRSERAERRVAGRKTTTEVPKVSFLLTTGPELTVSFNLTRRSYAKERLNTENKKTKNEDKKKDQSYTATQPISATQPHCYTATQIRTATQPQSSHSHTATQPHSHIGH